MQNGTSVGRWINKAGLSATQWQAAGLGVLLVFAILLPFGISNFTTFQMSVAFIYALALLGLNLLIGFNGQFSLGHGAFYAIGAYTTAVMIKHMEVHYLLTIPVGGALCFAGGFLFGFPALRIHGHYLALATLALALAMPQLLKYHTWEQWTGGVQGIVISKPNPPWGLPLSQDQWLYYVVLAFLVVAMILARNLLRSRSGRAMMAIRDNPTAAASMGINTARYKTLTFGVSAMFTGIAGCLSAIVIQFVAPDSFTVFLSITLVVGSVVGGLASISGAVFGGLFIQFIPNVADVISNAAPWAIYGVVMILFMYVMPSGIAGFVRMASLRLLRSLGIPRIGGQAKGKSG